MTERKKVPLAYVTRWAATRGIEVVRDGQCSEMFPDHFRWNGSLIHPNHWTTDKAEAEKRYRAALTRAYQSSMRKAKTLKAAINAPPKYTEET
jgi:hypothetical protein